MTAIARCWWIYTRFSSDMQSAHSCTDQERECRVAAERYGLGEVHAVRDEAVRAGATASREGWQTLIAAAEAGQVAGIMFEDLSRFSRDFFAGMTDLGRFRALGVKIADTKSGPIDLETQVGQFYVAIGLSTSQQETQRLGERSKRGLKGKTLDGFSSGGRPAYGLQRAPRFSETLLDPDGRPKRIGVRLAPQPVEAAIVARIFDLYDCGLGKHEIARRLNGEHVPTRDAGRAIAGRPNSGTWSAPTVKALLENSIYIGDRVWNRHSRTGPKLPTSGKKRMVENPEGEWLRVPGFCSPIVDQNVWDRVQLRLKAEASHYQAHHIANEHRQYILSGLLRCGSCGASYVIGARKKGVRHYRCSFKVRGVCSNSVTVPQPALEQRVRNVLDVVVKDPKKLAALVAEHNRRVSTSNEGQLAVVRSLEARRSKLTEERARYVEAIGFGGGAVKVLVVEVEKREKEIEELARQISEAEAHVQPLLLPRPAAVEDYLTGPASLFADDYARDKQLVDRVLEGIFVHADGTVSLRFREASLFAPVRSFDVTPSTRDASRAPVEAARKLHRDLFENGLAQYDECRTKPDRAEVTEAHGLPFYRFATSKNNVGVPSGTVTFFPVEGQARPIALVLCNVRDLDAA